MHVRATLSVCIPAVVLAVPMLSSASQSSKPGTAVTDVVEAASGYVAKYEQQLTSVLATEESTQRVLRGIPADSTAPRARALKSEMFFMFSPAEHEWMAVRDVHEVDGKAVEDPPDLKKAMATVPLLQIARTLKSYSSRYNLGTIVRNFGEPTLSLLVLDTNHRTNFTFARTKTENKSGVVLITLYYHEHGSDTLIHDVSGAAVQSQGEFVVEAGTGRIHRAILTVQMGSVEANLMTTYQPDTKLGIWVPSAFTEEYDDSPVAYGGVTYRQSETVHCEAKYSNFQRFETYGRIK